MYHGKSDVLGVFGSWREASARQFCPYAAMLSRFPANSVAYLAVGSLALLSGAGE